MYLMISAYDVLDHIHVKITLVDDPASEAMETTFKRTSSIPLGPWPPRDWRDVVAQVAEEALNLAYTTDPAPTAQEHGQSRRDLSDAAKLDTVTPVIPD